MLDFREIPSAGAGELRDTFELFAREFLVLWGFSIVEEPDRGPDQGRDLIVREDRSTLGGKSTGIRWLVSCKHKAHSGEAVRESEEINIRDRLRNHGCSGFIAFYSSLAGSALAKTLNSLEPEFECLRFDSRSIERRLLNDKAGERLAERFMPASFGRRKSRSDFEGQLRDGAGAAPSARQNSMPELQAPARELGEQTYDSFEEAKRDIYAHIASGPDQVKVFLYTASREINIKGALFEAVKAALGQGSRSIIILNASASSPNFDRQRLLSKRKDPEKVAWAIESANRAFRDLQLLSPERLSRRSHMLPFLWRLYLTSDRAYWMPYYTESRAFEQSPVYVYKRSAHPMYDVLERWFDTTWEQSAPEHASIGDIVPPSAPAGSSLFLQWRHKHVFGVNKKELKRPSYPARFAGIGGKRLDGEESIEACAIREGREELGNAFASLRPASETTYIRKDGTSRAISVSQLSTRPRLIFERPYQSGSSGLPENVDGYVLVAFDGILHSEPLPQGELAATLLIPDQALKLFLAQPQVTAGQLRAAGAEVIEQLGFKIADDLELVPHGTASFVVRNLGLGSATRPSTPSL